MFVDDNVVGDVQSESSPFAGLFGGKKGVKYLRSYLFRNSWAIIGDSKKDCFIRGPCFNLYQARTRPVL